MNEQKQKHTPGPWKASSNPGRPPTNWFVEKPMQGEDRFYLHIVAEIPNHSTQAEADARLIAAVPDLLNMLQRMVDETAGGGVPCLLTLEQARAVIRKAEGGAA
jgi:hypothetical protein